MKIDWSKAPEGATHYDPVDQNFLREVGPALLMYRINVGWVVPRHCQYAHTVEDTVRPLMIRPAWNGEGLPPAGTVCEYRSRYNFEWYRCEVLAHRNNSAVVIDDHYECDLVESRRFRPIRTADQIADEERRVAIAEMKQCFDSVSDDLVPTSNSYLEVLFGALHEAGYRKQVAP